MRAYRTNGRNCYPQTPRSFASHCLQTVGSRIPENVSLCLFYAISSLDFGFPTPCHLPEQGAGEVHDTLEDLSLQSICME